MVVPVVEAWCRGEYYRLAYLWGWYKWLCGPRWWEGCIFWSVGMQWFRPGLTVTGFWSQGRQRLHCSYQFSFRSFFQLQVRPWGLNLRFGPWEYSCHIFSCELSGKINGYEGIALRNWFCWFPWTCRPVRLYLFAVAAAVSARLDTGNCMYEGRDCGMFSGSCCSTEMNSGFYGICFGEWLETGFVYFLVSEMSFSARELFVFCGKW